MEMLNVTLANNNFLISGLITTATAAPGLAREGGTGEASFDTVIQNVRELVGGELLGDRDTTTTTTTSILMGESDSTDGGAEVTTAEAEEGADNEPECGDDCRFTSDDAVAVTTTAGVTTAASVSRVTNSNDGSAAATDLGVSPSAVTSPVSRVTAGPGVVVTSVPGVLEVSLTNPSPRHNESQFSPISPPQSDAVAGDSAVTVTLEPARAAPDVTVVEEGGVVRVEAGGGVMTSAPNTTIQISFPANTEESVTVRFTFGDEEEDAKEEENDIDDRLAVTETAATTEPATTTRFSPPPIASLPMFERDIFAPAQPRIEDNMILIDITGDGGDMDSDDGDVDGDDGDVDSDGGGIDSDGDDGDGQQSPVTT